MRFLVKSFRNKTKCNIMIGKIFQFSPPLIALMTSLASEKYDHQIDTNNIRGPWWVRLSKTKVTPLIALTTFLACEKQPPDGREYHQTSVINK